MSLQHKIYRLFETPMYVLIRRIQQVQHFVFEVIWVSRADFTSATEDMRDATLFKRLFIKRCANTALI